MPGKEARAVVKAAEQAFERGLIQGAQFGYEAGFRAAINMLCCTGADRLQDAIEEAREGNPDQPWEEES